MDKIKISVIVPVYNVEKYLRKCLDSIISQNLREIEIIIVNDCSPDNSLKIIQEYTKKDERIILVNKEKNEGLASARNSGLEIARGEYILHIDSDDWIEQNYFKDMYELAVNSNSDIVISDFYVDYSGKKLVYKVDQYGETGQEIDKRKAIETLGGGQSCYSVWNKLIKREIYKKNKLKFFDGICAGDDLITPILFYVSNKIIKLSKPYLHYVQNQGSITKKPKYSMLLDVYYSLNELERFFLGKNYDYFLKKSKFDLINAYIFKIKPNFEDEAYKKVLEEFLLLLEEKRSTTPNIKIVKYYNFFRKFFSQQLSFRIIWYLVNIKFKIKSLLV